MLAVDRPDVDLLREQVDLGDASSAGWSYSKCSATAHNDGAGLSALGEREVFGTRCDLNEQVAYERCD
jgi:hypothetical protein